MTHSTNPTAAVDSDALLALIRRAVVDLLPDIDPADIVTQRSLAEIGCNSVDRADVMVTIMDELGLSIPVWEFSQDMDIATIIALLRKYL